MSYSPRGPRVIAATRCAKKFTVHHLDGRTERRIFANTDEIREVLEGPFGLTLPDVPELEAALKRSPRRSANDGAS